MRKIWIAFASTRNRITAKDEAEKPKNKERGLHKILTATQPLLVVAFAALCLAQTAALDLKGDHIGLMLDQFRSLHRQTYHTYDGQQTTRQPECTGDSIGPQGPLEISDAEEKAGVIRCELQEGQTLANVPLTGAIYEFQHSRMYSMKAIFERASGFDSVRDAMERKFGQETAGRVAEYSNLFGAKFSGRVLVWRRGNATLLLVERVGLDDSGLYLYDDTIVRQLKRSTAPKTPDI